MSKIIYIDLTDLEQWHGIHGGTQRVVYGVAKEFFSDKDSNFDVRFMSYNEKRNSFFESSFEPIIKRVEEAGRVTDDIKVAESFEQKIKNALSPYIPPNIKQNKQAKFLLSKILVTTKSIKHKTSILKTISLHKQPKLIPIDFEKDDIVLVMGKPWDNIKIQDKLIEEHYKKKFKLVQLVYDLVIPFNPQLHHPSIFKQYTQNMFEAVSNSDLLLAISENTRNDILKFANLLAIQPPEIRVIRLGDNIKTKNDPQCPDTRIIQPFVASIGTIEIRKNYTELYYAYKLGLEKGLDLPQLVIIGSKGWLSDDIQYLIDNDPVLKDKLFILNNVGDNSLAWVYKNCSFAIYPSMYEGWGLPVAEILANGKFCIASHSSSIPEIAGDLIEYFSPYDTNQCLSLILKYYNNTSLLRKKETDIIQKYKITSWHDTYKAISSVI
jgi:glycosyltransferase involved in cell wall biosynthesis